MKHRLFTLLFLCASLPASAQEWTRFRGPNGSGLAAPAPGIPVQLSPSDINWKIELPGIGHSSPTLWGNRLFITCSEAASARRTLLCINSTDGSIFWQKDFDSHTFKQHPDNSYAAATPAVDADQVYICWIAPESYMFYAFDHKGNEIWKKDLGTFKSQHMNGGSPILFEDMVILAVDQDAADKSYVIAMDRKTGEPRWKTPRRSDTGASSTPCIYQPKEGNPQIIVTNKTDSLAALDAKTGKLIWDLPEVMRLRSVASPIVAGDLIIANCGEGAKNRVLVAVRPPDSPGQKPQIVYKITTTTSPYVPTPLFKDGRLFLWNDTGGVTCLKAASGEVLWEGKTSADFYGSPICVNDKLYGMSKKGELIVVGTGDKFELLARNPLNEMTHATPTVANGKMYLRTTSHLYSVGK
ncbi:MAG TPA: PQQ-binding-like beta-propeller repeat protein [Tepidisphaeraceae bacterium]|jgi:outer membrane protein assembly factor BamB|nr:PQQ-binding-like beta-propeller repeat protein [Tepidisphaeraceae bacterium]